MVSHVRVADMKPELETFTGDDRENYSGEQWKYLFMASDDQRYLVSFSHPAYTVIGTGVYILSTRFAKKERATTFVQDVANFLVYVRRPLCRFLVYVGELEEVERDGPRMRIPFVDPNVAFSGDVDVWGRLPSIDGVRATPPVQIGVPAKWVDRMWRQFSEEMPVIWFKMNRCVKVQRRHVVFEVKNAPPILSLSGSARIALSVGGRVETCGFFGIRLFRLRSDVKVYASESMMAGKNGYAVGHFGSLLAKNVSERYIDGHFASAPPVNVAIPYSLEPLWERRDLWPVEVSRNGTRRTYDPTQIRGGADVLSGTVRMSLDIRGDDDVRIMSYRDFHDLPERDIRSRCDGDGDVRQGLYSDRDAAITAARQRSHEYYNAAREWAQKISSRYARSSSDRPKSVKESDRTVGGSSRLIPVVNIDVSPERSSASAVVKFKEGATTAPARLEVTVTRSPRDSSEDSVDVKKRRLGSPPSGPSCAVVATAVSVGCDEDGLDLEPHPRDLFTSDSPARGVVYHSDDDGDLHIDEPDVDKYGDVDESLLDDSENEDVLPPRLAAAAADLRYSIEMNRKPDLRAKLDSKAAEEVEVGASRRRLSASSRSSSGSESEGETANYRIPKKAVSDRSVALVPVNVPLVSSPRRDVRAVSPVSEKAMKSVESGDKPGDCGKSAGLEKREKLDKLEKLEKRLSGVDSPGKRSAVGKSEKKSVDKKVSADKSGKRPASSRK